VGCAGLPPRNDGYATDADATAALVKRVAATGMRVGLAVSPDTPVEAVLPFAGSVSMVLIMTVHPGFGGLSFMPECLSKVCAAVHAHHHCYAHHVPPSQVAALRAAYPTLDIQVDGGLKPATIDAAAKAGANVIVAGTAVFKAPDPAEAISTLRSAVEGVLSS